MSAARSATRPGRPGAGHVFVVHGLIEKVVHDYALIPTAADFHVSRIWYPIVGEDYQRLQPASWPLGGFGKAHGRDDLWFVSVGGRRYSAGIESILESATAALREIAAGAPRTSRNRVKPLVAVPVLGIRGGGHSSERGEVVRKLIAAMARAAAELDLDIAVVTPDASVYAAAQHLRRHAPAWPLPGPQLKVAQRLGEAARRGHLALFMGAGVSIPAGLPTWGGLLHELAAIGAVNVQDGFESLSALDQAQYLHNRLPELGQHVADIVGTATVPSLSHVLLASLGCREAVTTNYDRLYESAVSIQQGSRNVATVLPWEPPKAERQWILKLHGDVQKPSSIVLTRQQFVSFDAETRPAGALLQTLLMTRHVLFVGASLNDDNVVRLAYEVDGFRRKYHLRGPVGTLLDVDDDTVRQQLWEDQLTWLTMAGESIQERSRTLEIFLDAVAAHASADSSWLLDERFRGLLDTDEGLIRAARSLYRRASAAGPEWQPVVDALAAFGGGAGDDQPI